MKAAALAFLSVLAATAAVAGEVNIHVLAIGVKGYPNYPADHRLEYTDRDAAAFADFWTRQAAANGLSVHVTKLLGGEATRGEIHKAIQSLDTARPDDLVFIFFAGHGEMERDDAYLMPYEASNTAPAAYGYRVDEFIHELRKWISARHVVIFIDACHAGGAIPDAGSRGDNGNITERFRSVWKEQLLGTDSTFVAFLSAGSREVAWEDPALRHGVFTHYLLEGLAGAADGKPFGDGNGIVTTGELYEFLRRQVAERTASAFPSKQTPVISPNYNEKLPLTVLRKPSAGAPAEAPLRADSGVVDTKFPLLPRDDGAPAAPSGEAATLLKKARTVVESDDLFCFHHPVENDLLSWLYYGQIAAYDAANQSLKIEESPWGHFYRGVALARLRAFEPALADLTKAEEGFREVKAEELATRTARMKDLIFQWRRLPAATQQPATNACSVDASRTVCELSERFEHPEEAAAPPPASVVDKLAALLDAPRCRDCITAAMSPQIECGEWIASTLTEAAQAARAYDVLLKAALREGQVRDAARFARERYLRLIVIGRRDEARQVATAHGALWDDFDLSRIALAEAFDTSASDRDFETNVVITRLDAATKRSITDVRAAARRHHAALEVLSKSLVEAAAPIDSSEPAVVKALSEGEGRIPLQRLEWLLKADAVSVQELSAARRALFAAISDDFARLPSAPTKLPRLLALTRRVSEIPHQYLRYAEIDFTPGAAEKVVEMLYSVALDYAIRSGRDPQQYILNADDFLPAITAGYRPVAVAVSSGLRRDDNDKVAFQLAQRIDAEDWFQDTAGFTQIVMKVYPCLFVPHRDVSKCFTDAAWSMLDLAHLAPQFKAVTDANERVKQQGAQEFTSGATGDELVLWRHLRLIANELPKVLAEGNYTDVQRFVAAAVYIGIHEGGDIAKVSGLPAHEGSDGTDLQKSPSMDAQAKELISAFYLLWQSAHTDPSPDLGARARTLAIRARNPIARVLAMAVPGVYLGMSRYEIRSFLALMNVGPAEPNQLSLPHFAVLAAMIDAALKKPQLKYDALRTLAEYLPDDDGPADYVAWVPVDPNHETIAAAMQPAGYPSAGGCRHIDMNVGAKDEGDDLLVIIHVACVSVVQMKWSLLSIAAAREQRWDEVAAALDVLEARGNAPFGARHL
ncbi:MAG TPA: caspase family protein, partial [Thermoanaerobaculia bacterium]|nr:caspase family protein [Thermoanaerobaculia bacterium]